jgi:hypothetical protein
VLDQRHGSRDVLGRDDRAVMHVGNHADAQAVEGWRQSAHRKVAFEARDLVALVGHAVGAYTGEGANRNCRGRPNKVPARDAHRRQYI